jgi:signal transduction histidine kinase
MVPALHLTGLVFAGLSFTLSLWVAVRCRRGGADTSDIETCRLVTPVWLATALLSLGVGLSFVPRTFIVGEVVVLVCAPAMPVIWGRLWRRVTGATDESITGSRRMFGVAVFATLAVVVYLYVSRPVYSGGVWFVDPGARWAFFVLLVLGAWAMSQFERVYRWSTGQTRSMMRWVRFWLALSTTLWLLTAGEGFFWMRLHGLWLPALVLVQAGSLLAVYRFLQNRALAHVPLSLTRRAAYTSAVVIILGAYLVFLGIVGIIIRWAGGDVETYISVLAAFLAVALLSALIAMPSMGRRLRRFIDRHVYKSRVDFAAEWTRITEEISGVLDLPSLVKTVAGFLQEAFSARVYIFLPVPGGGRFGLYYPFGHEFAASLPEGGEASDWLWRLGEPAFLTTWTAGTAAAEERRFLLALEQELQGRIAVPLLARRRFLGFALLGDRRDRVDYDDDDFEFLSAMSGPVAFAVLTGQVSEELMARREMESFNRVSTFVVHDLKNSISMLSLLLQNAKRHIADPVFQQSALKTISEAVVGMERLIGKISGGRDRLRPESRPNDLNRLITSVAERAGLPSHAQIDYCFSPGDIPAAMGDPLHLQRTIENLLINAVEAMNERGRLEVATGVRKDGSAQWVWMKISDTGCGMTREFASTRLFKPFESTKKKGLGIGMYQVREMVECDGGRVQFESEPGKGTTFEVSWRAAGTTVEKSAATKEQLTAPDDPI